VCDPFVFLLCFFIFSNAIPTQLNYQLNQEFVFNVNGNLDAKGALVNSQERTEGALSSMNGTLAIQCVQIDSNSYLFVMNMFNVIVSVGQGSEYEIKEMAPPGSGDTPLGYDMYYQQFFNGTIPKIWYNTADSPYYVNVKVGAINSLQTKLVAPANQQVVLFSDPIGVHTANVAGAASSGFLILQSTFDQTNFNEFADTNVHPNMVELNAETVTQIHPDGYIYSSNVNQYVNMIDMTPTSEKSHIKKSEDEDDLTGFNINLSSKGSLAVAFAGVSIVSNNGKMSNVFRSFDELTAASDYLSGSLTDITRISVKNQKKDSIKVDIVSLINKAKSISPKNRDSSYFNALSSVVEHLKVYNSDISLLIPFLSNLNEEETLADTIFYILSRLETRASQLLISRYGLESLNEKVKMSAFFSISNIENPVDFLIQNLINIVESSKDEKICANALYSLTNTIKNSKQESLRSSVKLFLINRINNAAKYRNIVSCLSTLLAIKNAGGASFIQRKQIPFNILTSLNEKTINNVLSQIYSHSFTPSLLESQFPFNKTYDNSKKLGGSVASVTFGADLFAGTNFNCNQPTFNYEAYAEASTDGSLFGVGFQAVQAKAIYGKANGVVVGDSMFLEIFGKTIYSRNFPVLDCATHTYPIAHASPGFSLSYTVWVSIIPITFSASTDLALNLEWGWQICDSPLIAEIELIPSATLVLGGNAIIDLLILRAGVSLSGSLNSELIPQGKVLGSECSLEFDVNWVSTPMSASFDAYYEWKHCKYLIFDCHWGVHHQTQLWGWTEPSHNEVVFNQVWKIA